MPATDDGEFLVVHTRLERTFDRLEEVITVVLNVERQQIVPEQAVQDRVGPWADAEGLGIGPRNMPELTNDDVRTGVFDEAREQREMVILDEHDRRSAADLLEHGFSETPIDAAVRFPIALVELWTRVRDVAERPDRTVCSAVVVAVFLLFGQPHPS
jgi:hypothetical protein